EVVEEVFFAGKQTETGHVTSINRGIVTDLTDPLHERYEGGPPDGRAREASRYWVRRYATPSSAAFGALNIVPVAIFSRRCWAARHASPLLLADPGEVHACTAGSRCRRDGESCVPVPDRDRATGHHSDRRTKCHV